MEIKLFIFLFILILSAVRGSPILELELLTVKSKSTGISTVIHYLDVPDSILEILDLNCKLPTATKYEWTAFGKLGSPFAASLTIGIDKDDFIHPWQLRLKNDLYPWALMSIQCTIKIDLQPVLKILWVIIKMKSGTDTPYHPIICKHPKAMCFRGKFDCYYERGLNYIGSVNRTSEGDWCQPWNSDFPNKRFPWSHLISEDGNHNFCRTFHGRVHMFKRPFCITSAPRPFFEKEVFIECNIPRCHDCIYGKGDGEYPNAPNPEKDYWQYPQYVGGGSITTETTFNQKKNQVHKKCYVGYGDIWKENFCKVKSNVERRRDPPDSVHPYCLVLVNEKISEDDLKRYDHPYYNHILHRWIRCTAPQCAVRQVWFLFFDSDDNPRYVEGNEEIVDMILDEGKPATIKFYHFGTTIINAQSLSLVGQGITSTFVTSLSIHAKETPQLSHINIDRVVKHLAGQYSIVYKFLEGNPILERVEYKANFQISIKKPTKITLVPVSYCPGYQISTKLSVPSNIEFTVDSLEWLYGFVDAQTKQGDWNSVLSDTNSFQLSQDGVTLKIKHVEERKGQKLFVKVKLKTRNSVLETMEEVNILKPPMLKVSSNNVEGRVKHSLKVSIEYDPSAKAKWIFQGKVINKERDYYIDSNREDGVMKEDLIIDSMRESYQGIYTVEVTDDGCTNSKTIYVSVS